MGWNMVPVLYPNVVPGGRARAARAARSPGQCFYVKHTKTKILCIKNKEPLTLPEKKPPRERTQKHQT